MDLKEEDTYRVKGIENLRKKTPGLHGLSDTDILGLVIGEVQNIINSLTVICFTEEKDDLLMWAHYANNHKGFCMGFELAEDWKDWMFKVKYDNSYPEIDLDNVLSADGTLKILTQKSEHWAYEKEWRRIYIEATDSRAGYPGELKEIILGARMPLEQKELIKDILSGSNTRIEEAVLHPSKYELLIA